MSEGSTQEMTLEQWVGKLLKSHLANREYRELQARVEELEKVNEALTQTLDETAAAIDHRRLKFHGIHITTKQIDAAVEWANTFGPEAITTRDRWEVLNIFNIVRCGGCKGGGRVYVEPRYEHIEEAGKCPDCAPWGSNGWVKDA